MTNVSYAQSVTGFTDPMPVIAQQNGYFAKNHLNVKFVNITGGSNALASIISGSTEFGSTSVPVLLLGTHQKAPVEAVALNEVGFGASLVITTKKWDEKHMQPTTSVDEMANDIKGLNIGNMAPKATSTLIMDGLVKNAGHSDPAGWFSHNSVRAAADQLVALQHGSIDGAFANSPVPEQAVAGGYAKTLFDLGSVPEFSQLIFSITVAKPSWADSHATLVREFIAAMTEAQNFILQHPAEAAQQMKPLAPSLSVAQIQEVFKRKGYTTNLAFPDGSWEAAAQLSNKYNLEPFTVTADDYKSAYTNKFVS